MEQTTALTTAETSDILSLMRSEVSRPRLPAFPTIKMRNAKSSMKDIAKGEFAFIKVTETEDGKKEDIRPLGANPKVIILKRRYSYSFYDEDTEELVAWTNELDRFAEDQVVKLAKREGGKKTVMTFTWPQFKAWKETDELGKKLSFRNILYVCVDEPKVENVARLFVSNASVTGVVDGEKTGDYKHPLPGSFLEFEKPISWSNGLYAEVICELGSKWLEQNEYYLMTFKNVAGNDRMEETAQLYKNLIAELVMRYQQDFGVDRAPARPEAVEVEVVGVPVLDYASEIKVEDLPF